MSLTPHGGVLVNRVNEAYDFQHIAHEIELHVMAFSDLQRSEPVCTARSKGFMTENMTYLSRCRKYETIKRRSMDASDHSAC